MKTIVTVTIILLTLSACTGLQRQTLSEPAATATPQINIPNPAAVYCEQNGFENEIRTADDGSQSGDCIFPDWSTCDEWAFFRGECGMTAQGTSNPIATIEATSNASGGYMQPGTSEPFTDWWGVIQSAEMGSQYDDYFARQDLGGTINFGIDATDPEVKEQIEELRDSGKVVHLYGTLFSNVPDYNGSQVKVDRIEVDG